MERKIKTYTAEFKYKVVRMYLEGTDGYKTVGSKMGIHGSLVSRWAKAYQLEDSCIPFPNMEHVLKELRNRGILLGMITNGFTEFQRLNIRALGIDKYIDIILVSEQEGIKKPQAEIFQRALERLNVSPKESVYVGDHPENDVIAARNVGMNAVWKKDIFWGNPFTDEHVIDDLEELLNIVATFQEI